MLFEGFGWATTSASDWYAYYNGFKILNLELIKIQNAIIKAVDSGFNEFQYELTKDFRRGLNLGYTADDALPTLRESLEAMFDAAYYYYEPIEDDDGNLYGYNITFPAMGS